MKLSLRLASAALALTFAAGAVLPAAAAANNAFTKEETVYAVLNADGSLRSTTVSVHLHHDDGLAPLEDRTTLTDIVNTESDAPFTQNGETLVWDTSDTDLYYKGTSARELPLSAQVTYCLDGVEAPLEELLGKSGHLTVCVRLTNHETGTLSLDGRNLPVVTPFVAAVGVLLGAEASNVTAPGGLLGNAAQTTAAAFVTLPGVREVLDGLVPEAVDALEAHLPDSVTLEADVDGLTAPQILIASAANAEVLRQDSVFSLDSVGALTDGIAQLNDAMDQLLDGAAQLLDGAAQLASGSLVLQEGASQLNNGLEQLSQGLDLLVENNIVLTDGARQIADGVLATASDSLMSEGMIDTPLTWESYEAVLDGILALGEDTLAAGRKKMVRTIQQQAPQFKASQLDLALYLAATQTESNLEAALRLMESYHPSIFRAMLQKVLDPNAQQIIRDELLLQTEQSEDIASVRALKENLAQIRLFVEGVAQYTDGVAAASQGAHTAQTGSAQLAEGAQALADGAAQLADGATRLNNGLVQFNAEGISRLTGAMSAEQLDTLTALVEEMGRRMEEYTSFSGTPDGASCSVKFLYKTAETPAVSQVAVEQEAPAPHENFFVRLWRKLIALFRF